MLALFDLDKTLLDGDSDLAWGQFLCDHGHVDAAYYRAENERFYAAYEAGTLDIRAFLEFALQPLAAAEPGELRERRARFIDERIVPMCRPRGRALVDRHRSRGDTPVIITATNRFITEPIARLFGVDHLLATEPETDGPRYTGRVAGTPCFREGKVERLETWAAQQGVDPFDACFYSDSHNDLPLLERVRQPHAVDPDPELRAHAEARGWPVLSLAEDPA